MEGRRGKGMVGGMKKESCREGRKVSDAPANLPQGNSIGMVAGIIPPPIAFLPTNGHLVSLFR